MSSEDIIEEQLQSLQQEANEVMEKVQVYQRKVMTPVWEKRREMIKKIPGFWGTAIGNHSVFGSAPSEEDVEALENLTDFHVEFDEANPNYRKVIAAFKKNNVFKNETLTKEFVCNADDEGSIISKSTIDYIEKKNNKRKAEDNEHDEPTTYSFLDWFGDDSIAAGVVLTDHIFPDAVEFYKGIDEDDSDDEDLEREIELVSEDEEDDEEDEEEEKPKAKKSRK